jgi:hypothetical protein
LPANEWSTFGRAERMRLPMPAARITMFIAGSLAGYDEPPIYPAALWRSAAKPTLRLIG